MKKQHHAFGLLLLLFVACNEQEEQNYNTQQLKIIESKGIWQNPDSFAKPLAIPAGTPKTILAGKPNVKPTNLNVHLADLPEIIIAGKPKVNTPGTDTFLLPEKVPATGVTRPAGLPETVIAKDMASKDQNPGNFSFFKVLQGLKHNSTRCILRDKTGKFWFGTYGGVCRYDGKSFTSFTDKEGLINNLVYAILEDKKGNLWFGTHGGISCYDGKCFTNFTEKEGLADNFVLSILEDKAGNLWIGTHGGVCRYDGKSFTNFTTNEGLANNSVYSILEDKAGNFWFGTKGGVSYYNGKSFTNFTTNEGLPNNKVYSILEDKTGSLWFGTKGGISNYNGKLFKNFTVKEGLPNNKVYSILEDKTGNLWLGTEGGLCRYDGNRVDAIENGDEIAQQTQQDLRKIKGKIVRSFTNFTDKEGLANNVVYSVLEGKGGNLWLGTSGGVCRYHGKSFINFTDKEGLANSVVLSILEDKAGNLWFGTNGGGVSRYDGKSFTNFTDKEGLPNNFVYSMLQDKTGNLWFGTYGGVCRYDGKSFTSFTKKEGLINNFVYSILEDKSGNLWFGTYGGATRYDGKSFTNFTKKEGLVSDFVLSILEDKTGNLWFGTYGGGISRYNVRHSASGAVSERMGSFTSFTEKEGLSNNFVLSVLEDKNGNLWFGTNDGVCCYNGKSFINFTEKEGLLNNFVLSILQDESNNLWFGTRKGLSKITSLNLAKLTCLDSIQQGKKNENSCLIKEGLFYNYGYNDGFLGLNCQRSSVLQDSKGRIWWGADLLTCYTPEGEVVDTTVPVVQLNSIKLFGEEIAWETLGALSTDSSGKEIVMYKSKDTTLGNGVILHDIKFDGITKLHMLPQNLSLPYNNNNLTFNFIGVHMQGYNHIKYQYKLQGLERNWSSITARTEAPYGNLPSGDYTFKVRAMNQSGLWSKVSEFNFVVRPPWWQTWWFRALVVLFVALCIWYFIKRREDKLRREKELLEQTVLERTAEVVKQKDIIEEQKHLVEEKHKEITDSIRYAERIQQSFLATKELLDENLKDHFVFFKPKAVVSGDFYWASKIAVYNRTPAENFILVTADSTGHGVPGAIMSLLNIMSLEKAIENNTEPSAILNATRKTIIERLKNDGSDDGGKDGMDCSLISFDFTNNKLTYSAANNPFWIIRGEEILEFKSDQMPVGKHDFDQIPFTQHTIDLQKGDAVYTFTDGISDQFGGPKGKKFMYKQLKKLLLYIAPLSMQEQKEKLSTALTNWKGSLEQVDDICVIGIRV